MITRWKFRFYPTHEQKAILAKTFGCCRFVYNYYLRLRSDAYQERGEKIGYEETSRLLTLLKKQPDTAFLKEVAAVPLQQSLVNLQRAYVNFFEKRAKYPSFKKKNNKQSATYVSNAFHWIDDHLVVTGLGQLKVHWSREVAVDPTSISITKCPSGKYFVSLTLNLPDPVPLPINDSVVGVDLGIARLVTLNNGERIPNPKYFAKNQKKLTRLQRLHARKKKDSKRREKARIKVARLHEHISNCRKDNLDKITTKLVQEHCTIVIEDLNVQGMVKNHSLARSINDASWGMFRKMIEYKAEWTGRTVIVANQFYPSSKLCSDCGYQMKELPLEVRSWTCPECSSAHDRDHNAAKNLQKLAVGHTVTARGGSVRPSRTSVRKGKTRRTVNL